MQFTTSLAIALSAAFGINQEQVQVRLPAPMPEVQTVEEYVREYFIDEPLLAEIARCESHFRQFGKDGSVHRGRVNKSDLGIMQVNEYYHGEVAEKLGLDIYTIQGNVAYARYLYDKEGSTPWSSSKPCWGKTTQYKEIALNKTK